MFCKKSVQRSFVKFRGKHLCKNLFFATLLKNRIWRRCFPVNFAKFLRTPLLTEDLLATEVHFSLSCKTLKKKRQNNQKSKIKMKVLSMN